MSSTLSIKQPNSHKTIVVVLIITDNAAAKLNTREKSHYKNFQNPNSGNNSTQLHSWKLSKWLNKYQESCPNIFRNERSYRIYFLPMEIYLPTIIITRQVNVLERTKLAKWTVQIFRPANQVSQLKKFQISSLKCHARSNNNNTAPTPTLPSSFNNHLCFHYIKKKKAVDNPDPHNSTASNNYYCK